MKILVGKTFGIGNACLSVPMVKALSTIGEVDVLIGSSLDDLGAYDVFFELRRLGCVQNIWVDSAPGQIEYDAAVMAIPFDGRWQNGRDFTAKRVMDGRKRPGNVERLGFDMWKKHESEYQMDDARELGFKESLTPPPNFLDHPEISTGRIYLGLGYKRDPGGFGLSKHWGNERYINFIHEVRRLRPGTTFVSTGNVSDLYQTGSPLMRSVGPEVLTFEFLPIGRSFDVVRSSLAYFGNDTGMMHVAASLGLPTFGLMAYPDLLVKNPPLGPASRAVLFNGFTSTELALQFVDFVWGDKR